MNEKLGSSMRKTLETIVWCSMALVAVGCDKSEKPAGDVPIRAKSVEQAPTAAASSAAPEPPPPVAVKIRPGAVAASWTPDGKRWVKAFTYSVPEGAVAGASWADALKTCRSAGLDLCSEQQWQIACGKDSVVGQSPSWTITPASGDTWVVRGGSGCSASEEAAGDSVSPARIGLCCERAAAISSVKRSDAWMKTAQTYIGIVEDALNSKSPQQVVNLLADPAKLFKTRMTNDEALRDLRSDAEKYAEWNYRLFSCDAEVDTQHGSFECDTVETRTPKAGARELSVFRMRFEYGPPNLKYSVFADPVRITRKWAPY
jgi:hypothetical protein